MRCGKAILDVNRRVYCSEGCADAAAHLKRLQRLHKGTLRLAKFRVYQPKGPAQ
jgi:hypothetical protein